MRVILFVTAAVVAAMPGAAQWLNYPAPGTPRTPDGKPNLAAKAPRTREGKPDLSGAWLVHGTPLEEQKRLFGPDIDKAVVLGMERDASSKYAFNILQDFKPGDSPMRPEAAAIVRVREKDLVNRPGTNCLPQGIPLANLFPWVQKIVQTPGLIVVMLEADGGATRQIYTDGRKLPVDPFPSWLGYSVGKWDGDTLVVETNGLNDKVWLDAIGHPRSEAMHMTERFHRPDFGHLDIEFTFDDPKNYTRPFSIKVTHVLQADSDILEYFCLEGEKDRTHMRN
jgi:hypothetical protein